MPKWLTIIAAVCALLISNEAYAKSPPPGTGADDVPANILLMLDTSGSMDEDIPTANLRYPTDITYDTDGNIYISEYYDTIKRFDSEGNFLGTWGGYGTGNGKFDLTYGISSDSSNNIYVSDRYNGRVQKFSSDGTFITSFSVEGGQARGLDVSGSSVYVVNGDGDVEVFTLSGVKIDEFNTTGGYHIAADSSGNVFLTKIGSQRIDKYTGDGTYISSINTSYSPFGIDIDSSDYLYVSGVYSDRVYVYNASGSFLNSFGGYGSDPDEYNFPWGVHIDPSGTAQVADMQNHRVHALDGTLLIEEEEDQNRLEAAIDVIKAIVSDSNLTSGANFGLMEWNSSSDLMVEVSNDGAGDIYTEVDSLSPGGSTYLGAAMEAAEDYFLGPNTPMTPGLDCQENILIVVSDGFWQDDPDPVAQSLYDNYGIKTFTVGFLTTGDSNYVTLSQMGGTYPDSPLFASNKDQLLEVLSNYIQQVISSQLTFSAPTIIPNTASDEAILQSTFTYKTDHQWKGRLLKYELLESGMLGDLLWDAGEELNDKPADSRNIWTVVAGIDHSLNNFTTSELERLRFPLEEFSGTSYTDEELEDLIEFTRGKDSYNEYPTDEDDEGTQLLPGERWKLADIYHSKASIVGKPSAYSSINSSVYTEAYYRHVNGYGSFKTSNACGTICNSRQEIIYVGANDGMLHAFDSDTGEELWAFIPPSLLGSLKDVINDTGITNSIYGVDGSPTVKDIYYDGAWRTVLMSGLRQGGHSYFALDVTDPLNPSHLFTVMSRPTYNIVSYWDADGSRSDYDISAGVPFEYDFSELGETWSQPIILNIDTGLGTKWVAAVAGGYNNGINPNYGAQVYIMDLEDGGKILQNIELTDGDAFNSIVNSAVPKITAISADSTTLFQSGGAMLYVTDLEGKLWKINLSDTGVLYDTNILFNAEATSANDRYGYHEIAASVLPNQRLMLYYGTGDIQRLGRIDAAIQNRAFGVEDIYFPGFTSVPTYTAADLQDMTGGGAGCFGSGQSGWYVDLDADEKVTSKLTVSNKTVFLSRYTPNTDNQCSAGTTKLTEIGFMCGDNIRDADLGSGVPTEAIIYKDKLYLGVSDDSEVELPEGFTKVGNLIIGDPALDAESEVRIESWREDF